MNHQGTKITKRFLNSCNDRFAGAGVEIQMFPICSGEAPKPLSNSRNRLVIFVTSWLICIYSVILLAGCSSSTDHPPTAMKGQFDMRPVPKHTGEHGMLGALQGIFIDVPAHLLGKLTGQTPLRDVRMMEDPNSPDQRREGIYYLVENDFAQREPYTKRYRQIAQNDPDETVRAAAVRALNWSRDEKAVPVFIAALKDSSPLVRWEAAKALSNIPDPSAKEPLMALVGNPAEDRDVRIAGAEALRNYRDEEVARVLAGTVGGRDFGLAWQSRWSLRILTGKDFQYDETAWLQYLTGPQKPLG
jgi:hypothetical protein